MADSKLKSLIEKRNIVNARIKKEQNKLRTSERKSDTRRKILAGAAVLEWAAKDNEFSAKLIAELKRFLVRDADRALFGLPPVQGKEPFRAGGEIRKADALGLESPS
jgi:hypothetical protein